ncbi:MAG: Sec-independent protein translocase protein TatB [Marinagarivorans sp.]|nr:Sec-independent protein translocase protein TatB [Marinagarivorans sp.]
MFDIGLFELLVVGGVSLVVIGPERLPAAIKTGALWIGRLKRTIVQTRREIEQHIGADDIRRQLHNEEIMASLEQLRKAREQLERDIAKEMPATIEYTPSSTQENNDAVYNIATAPEPETTIVITSDTTSTHTTDTPTSKP